MPSFVDFAAKKIMIIKKAAFLGGAEFKETDAEYHQSFATAKLLAENGLTILNGGGPGVMRAATEGAHAGRGRAIGVTYYPAYRHEHYEGRDPKNLFDEEVVMSDYGSRTMRLLEMADVHIIFRGGTGTISEFGLTWAESRIHHGHNIPFILFGDFWQEIIDSFKKYLYMRLDEFKIYAVVDTPEQVLVMIRRFEIELPNRGVL